jgi:predicted HTH transcriptional regulator
MINEDYTYLKGVKVPWSESSNIEFKESFCRSFKEKYIKSICAFLNQKDGGCILFGIDDCGIVKGFCPSGKKRNSIDHIKLMMDDIVSQDLIFSDGTPLPLDGTIRVNVYPISVDEFVIVVAISSKKSPLMVTMPNGDIYVRGNASTRLLKKGPVFYTQNQLKSQIKERVLQEEALKTKALEEMSKNHIIDMELLNQILYDARKMEREQEQQKNEKWISSRVFDVVVCFFFVASFNVFLSFR